MYSNRLNITHFYNTIGSIHPAFFSHFFRFNECVFSFLLVMSYYKTMEKQAISAVKISGCVISSARRAAEGCVGL